MFFSLKSEKGSINEYKHPPCIKVLANEPVVKKASTSGVKVSDLNDCVALSDANLHRLIRRGRRRTRKTRRMSQSRRLR
jgi:hypothetical protein